MANAYQPSRVRRAGRDAYFSQGNPEDHCPFNSNCGVFLWEGKRRDWLDGWEEARKADRERIRAQDIVNEELNEQFDAFLKQVFPDRVGGAQWRNDVRAAFVGGYANGLTSKLKDKK